jgi:hypothetical protein
MFAESYSEWIPIIITPAEDENRVSVPQWVDLRSHVDGQCCDHGGDE